MDRAWLGIIAVLAVTGCGGINPVVSNSSQSHKRDMAADADISRYVRRMILADELMSPEASNLYVSTRNGVVTLSGAVGSEDERAKVRQFAELVTAKNAVRDQMQVIPLNAGASLLRRPEANPD